MTCSGVEGSSATHKHNAVKSSVNLTWEAPEIQVMEIVLLLKMVIIQIYVNVE